jgi:adenylate cyclase
MLCPYCHHDNSSTNAFCTRCGKPLGLACIACGHLNQLDSRFCGKCSQPLPSAETPPSLGDEVLRSLSASGGERKRLTLVFADISNSTSLIERSDPEDAMRRLQPALDAMKRVINHYDGVVNKVRGDGIMALFGAPRPHEDHAQRACAAALAMQMSVGELGDESVKIRVGIHTGTVVVQAVENSFYLTYDVAGPAAHLAARMEEIAESGEILLSGDTEAATRQFVETISLGPRVIRGLSEPVEIFRLRGLRHAPASESFRSRPHLSPLTGRSAEFQALEAALASAANGEANVVGVVGEAGTGKSRLCFEFAESCRKRGIEVYEARVQAHTRATPYQAVLGLLRDYVGIKEGQPAAEVRRRVTEVVARLPVANDALLLLLDFLGVADPNHPAPRVDPAIRKMRLIELVRSMVRSSRRNQPAVVLVDDVHWIDAASSDFVEAMADAVVGTATLLLLNFRSGYVAPWMQRSHYRQINLSPLGPAEMDELLSDLLGIDPSVRLISLHIARRAQGNPFFIEELVHSLIAHGDLEGERGAYRLVREVEKIPLPTTIEALLAARIDHLDETAKRVLHCAAVIGREVPVAILERVTGLPPVALTEALSRLQRAELLRELSFAEGRRCAFCHPLIQEVCYLSLLRERRRKIHSDVARAIKLHFTSRWEERASLLAYHLEEAGELMEAAQATMRAAMWIGTHDASQALSSWKKVHQLLATQPTSESIDYLRMITCQQILTFGWRAGMAAEESYHWFEEAKQLALAAGNLRSNAWSHALLGRNLAVRGSADEYVQRMREAVTLAIEAHDGSAEVMLKATLAHALRLAGHLHEALKVNEEAASRVHELIEFDRQLFGFAAERWLAIMRAQTLIPLGRFDEARLSLDKMLQTNIDSNDITYHLIDVTYVELALANNDKALAQHHAERALAIAGDDGSPYVRVNAQACRGLSYIISGQFEAAIDDLERALTFARRRNTGLEIEARILADLANAYRLKGDLQAARRTATEAIDVAVTRAARISECLARIVLAEVLLKLDEPAGAGVELPKARALMEQTGAVLYQPLVRNLAAKIERGMETTATDKLVVGSSEPTNVPVTPNSRL